MKKTIHAKVVAKARLQFGRPCPLVGEASLLRRLFSFRPTSLLRRRDPRTEERKAVQIQRVATDLFNTRQPLQFTARDVEFAKPADTQYITRGGDGAPEQPGALRMRRPLRQISLSASQKGHARPAS
jgi:hypothetical protein